MLMLWDQFSLADDIITVDHLESKYCQNQNSPYQTVILYRSRIALDI